MSPLSGPEPRWRAVASAALTSREWDAEVVVYNGRTGSTHLLDAFAGAILRELGAEEAGVTIANLAVALTGEPGGGARDDFTAAIAAVLAEFERLGLAHAEQP